MYWVLVRKGLLAAESRSREIWERILGSFAGLRRRVRDEMWEEGSGQAS